MVGDYNEWTNEEEAVVPFIISTETSEGLADGYIYLTTGGIKFIEVLGSWADETTFGDDGAGSLTTSPSDNIPVAEDGLYYITANLADMTYSLLKMNWGIVGDATPGGWDGQTPLAYEADLNVLKGTADLVAGQFKFRANSDWAVNFGGDWPALNQDGADIVIDDAGNYTLTLNPWTGEGSINLNE